MSSLKDRLDALKVPANYKCPIGKLLDALDAEDSEALQSALDARVSSRALARELQGAGIRVDRDRINPHRNGKCGCQ